MNIRPATASDPKDLAPHLREADLMEIAAASGDTPKTALEKGFRGSTLCYTVEEGKLGPIAMFGVTPDLEVYEKSGVKFGYVWLLGADEVVSSPKEFMRLSREWVTRLFNTFEFLANFVDARNAVHVRWLKSMGFKFTDAHPGYGNDGEVFLEFYATKEMLNV